jgi:hypothetical protein
MGRPSKFTQQIADTICERLATAEGGLEEVCKSDDVPEARTIYRWLNDDDKAAFRQSYARARDELADFMAHKAVSESLVAKDAQLGRLHFDARKWAASKLNAKRWGDKVALTGGDDDDKPIKFERIERVIRDPHAND